MKEIINKIFKATNFHEIDRFITFNILDIPNLNLNKIEFKNTYTTDISSIEPTCNDLFFEYFPYNPETDSKESLLPPRLFYDYSNDPTYLLTENTQKENKEYCPYINFIKSLKFFGTLKQKKDKTVYLEIENDFFINLISKSLCDPRIEKSSNFNITIISKEEYEKNEVYKIFENDLNQRFEFQIKDLFSIHINEEEFTDKIWFLEIESRELEEFRYKYHLFPKTNGYNFSIALGFIKYFKLRKSFPKMRINISFFAA